MQTIRAELCMMLLVVVSLTACGGGGGGGGNGAADNPLEREAQRDQAFQDEAVERVLDRATINCMDFVCSGDAIMSLFEGSEMIIAACEYSCLPVEIDLDEQRFYQVRLLWRRTPALRGFEETCFVKDEFEIQIVARHQLPCVPTP